MLIELPKRRFELGELVSHRAPFVAEESKRFVLDLLPLGVGPVVGRYPLGREPRVTLPAVALLGEVDQTFSNERLNVPADRRRVGADRLGEIAERKASRYTQRGEDRPLRAADAGLTEGVVESGRERTTGAPHPSSDAAHRFHDVDVQVVSHIFHMHLLMEEARSRTFFRLNRIDVRGHSFRCIYK